MTLRRYFSSTSSSSLSSGRSSSKRPQKKVQTEQKKVKTDPVERVEGVESYPYVSQRLVAIDQHMPACLYSDVRAIIVAYLPKPGYLQSYGGSAEQEEDARGEDEARSSWLLAMDLAASGGGILHSSRRSLAYINPSDITARAIYCPRELEMYGDRSSARVRSMDRVHPNEVFAWGRYGRSIEVVDIRTARSLRTLAFDIQSDSGVTCFVVHRDLIYLVIRAQEMYPNSKYAISCWYLRAVNAQTGKTVHSSSRIAHRDTDRLVSIPACFRSLQTISIDGIAVSASNVFVTNASNGRVMVFSHDLVYVKDIERPKICISHYRQKWQPTEICTGGGGKIFVVDGLWTIDVFREEDCAYLGALRYAVGDRIRFTGLNLHSLAATDDILVAQSYYSDDPLVAEL